MISSLENALLHKVSQADGTSIYEIQSESLSGKYFIVDSPEARHLMESPEVVGYDSYLATLPGTAAALDYLRPELEGSHTSILTILRGGLNYPLEECCHATGIQINNINFVSCERIIRDGRITGLDIKYEKFHVEKDSTLMIGDILASGDTLRHCMKQVAERICARGGSLRRIIFFTIGGTKGISLMEEMTRDLRALWPEFEGFTCFFHEGVFSVYEDHGVTGVNTPDIDFGWQDGIIAPEFRSHILSNPDALFEKCIIYDGGARRYEIPAHCEEVVEYWERLLAVAENADFKAFLAEKIGYSFPLEYSGWLAVTKLADSEEARLLYAKEQSFIDRTLQERTLVEVCGKRLSDFRRNMSRYMDNTNK